MGFSRTAIKTLLAPAALSITIIAGCSSGSDSSSASPDSAGFTSGEYKFTGQVADIHCSDGSLTRKGYGITGKLVADGEFLLFKGGEQTYGRGHLTADGKFHLSVELVDSGLKIAATLDGKKTDTGFSGLSQAAWTTEAGLNCRQTSQFTAALQGGGA